MGTDKEKSYTLFTWIVRIIVGTVFIFSGFTKGVDPYGTLYKFDAYFSAMGLSPWQNLELVLVFLLCASEFLTGVFLLLGCFRRSVSIFAALIMLLMLPLSFWLAVWNPVTDCGCFGDALHLSNLATFLKNVLISLGVIWLIRNNKKCHWLVTPALQWMCFVVSCMFILVIELYGYMAQPLVDYRPYKIGETLIDDEEDSEESMYVFIYEKDGERKEISNLDSLPAEDSGWVFVDRREMIVNDGASHKSNKEKNIRIWDKTGEEDLTDEVLNRKDKQLLIWVPELSGVSPATTWQLNSLYEWSLDNDVEMAAVVSGSEKEIEDWEDLSMASYPIYTSEDTMIEEVVRGNPGVVYLIDGKVKWKSTLTAINIDDFLSPGTSKDAMTFGTDSARILRNCLYLYLIIMSVLVFLSFTPAWKKFFFPRMKKKQEQKGSIIHDDTVHLEE